MDLLLFGDEQENMIKKYLYRGEAFALYNDDLKTVCVVTKEEGGIYEIKNIATYEKYQGKGYGKYMVEYIIENYRNKCNKLYIGTGDNEKILSFYKDCGFIYSHTVKDSFIRNYDHKIYEDAINRYDLFKTRI